MRLGELVERVPRSAITTAELAGGLALCLLSSAPLRIAFTDGTTWGFEVSRFYRRHAKHVMRALGGRQPRLTGPPTAVAVLGENRKRQSRTSGLRESGCARVPRLNLRAGVGADGGGTLDDG